ncbi:hypothetical protein tinsulaeT_23350 [Thalassotalea insulae]|uniref:DUF4389 domain-containing protein n=1 Tax=Thalassotalea insulae TaxID=2056778 RepID=A0ABQ6GWA3_9GAMM|nr:DUF4389 domain-containing protein [Thalassotalea insulae]GLX78995.1 hypothetical protein tinsulaeT_23350 [Thalassotalea insulae]
MYRATNETTRNWQNTSVWLRGLFMLLFGFIGGFARFLVTIIAVFQFFSLLLTRKANAPLKSFGESLNNYIYQINQFLTVNSEQYPFPLSSWPDEKPVYRYSPRD